MLKKTITVLVCIVIIGMLLFHVNLGRIIKVLGPKAQTLGDKVEKIQESVKKTIIDTANQAKNKIERKLREKAKHVIGNED